MLRRTTMEKAGSSLTVLWDDSLLVLVFKEK